MELVLGHGLILGFTSTKPKLGKKLATTIPPILCIKPFHGNYIEIPSYESCNFVGSYELFHMNFNKKTSNKVVSHDKVFLRPYCTFDWRLFDLYFLGFNG
jgi:hypothetical protein